MSKKNVCPICGWKALPFVYGLPSPADFDRKDIILGGCIVDPMNPDLGCSNCNWSGQKWALQAPLPLRMWIIRDPEMVESPIGLVTERFDQVVERFQLGYWEDAKTTSDYQNWLKQIPEPDVWLAMADRVSPAVVAQFRSGRSHFTDEELEAAGFEDFGYAPPLFELRDRSIPRTSPEPF